jgi:hypothetical protein
MQYQLRTREEILEERRQLKAEYGQLVDSMSALLFRHDPIGIAFDNENTAETGTILPGSEIANALAMCSVRG